MVFWIGILIAAIFAYSAVKLGFYQAWTILFNVVIAVYVGIKLAPVVEDFVPMSGQYTRTIAVLAVGLGTFLVLQGIAYVFLIGQFMVTFPRGINMLGSGLLGFLTGLLIWSYIALVICTSPLSDNEFVKDVGFESKNLEQAKLQPYLVWCCNFVDKFVASGDEQTGVEQEVKDLLTKTAHDRPARPVPAPDVNVPKRPSEPAEGESPDSHTVIPP